MNQILWFRSRWGNPTRPRTRRNQRRQIEQDHRLDKRVGTGEPDPFANEGASDDEGDVDGVPPHEEAVKPLPYAPTAASRRRQHSLEAGPLPAIATMSWKLEEKLQQNHRDDETNVITLYHSITVECSSHEKEPHILLISAILNKHWKQDWCYAELTTGLLVARISHVEGIQVTEEGLWTCQNLGFREWPFFCRNSGISTMPPSLLGEFGRRFIPTLPP
ncbi:hypothetical protein BHM03_00010180 [Ensete ventricosum]|nr:hypothetical protein BHM03_00010180 [Ensete ventricosum]